jgi:hypothetical protein
MGADLSWPIPIIVLVLGALAAFAVFVESAQNDPLIGGPKTARLESSIADSHPIIGVSYIRSGRQRLRRKRKLMGRRGFLSG